MTVTNHELIAIQTECREQLLAQLKANGLDPFTFYAWAQARDLEDQAAQDGISVSVLYREDTDAKLDEPSDEVRIMADEVRRQLIDLGHEI